MVHAPDTVPTRRPLASFGGSRLAWAITALSAARILRIGRIKCRHPDDWRAVRKPSGGQEPGLRCRTATPSAVAAKPRSARDRRMRASATLTQIGPHGTVLVRAGGAAWAAAC